MYLSLYIYIYVYMINQIFDFSKFFENHPKTLKNNPPTSPKASRIRPKFFDFLTPEAEGRPSNHVKINLKPIWNQFKIIKKPTWLHFQQFFFGSSPGDPPWGLLEAEGRPGFDQFLYKDFWFCRILSCFLQFGMTRNLYFWGFGTSNFWSEVCVS